MAWSVTQRVRVLSWFRGTNLPAPPASFYVAALTSNPSDDAGTGAVEVSTGAWTNYARVAIAASTGAWNAPAGGTTSPQSISNAAAIDFGTAATTGNVTVTGLALYDAASGGTLIVWAALTASKIVQNGDPVQVTPGSLVISE